MLKINGYLIDIAIELTETYEAEVTEYPVESGGSINDNLNNRGVSLSVKFKVSDTPTGEIAKARSANVVPSSEARGYLLALRASREPFTVEAVGRIWDNLVFETLEFPVDDTTGAALDGNATLREVRIADVVRTVVTMRDLGARSARVTDRYHIWYCPPPLLERVGDDAFNERQGCRKINYVKINGKYTATFADNGKPLDSDDVAGLNRQFKDRSRNSTFFDQDTGQWMRNDVRAGRGEVIPNQGDPFGIFSDPDNTFGVQTLPDEAPAPVVRDRPEIGRMI